MLRMLLAIAMIASLAVVGSVVAQADEVGAYPATATYPTATYPTATYSTGTYPAGMYRTSTYPNAYPANAYPANAYPTTRYYATGNTYAAPGYAYSPQYASYPNGYYSQSSYNAWYCHCRSGLFGRGGFLGTGLFR